MYIFSLQPHSTKEYYVKRTDSVKVSLCHHHSQGARLDIEEVSSTPGVLLSELLCVCVRACVCVCVHMH